MIKVTEVSASEVIIPPRAKHDYEGNTFLRVEKDGWLVTIAIPDRVFGNGDCAQPIGLNLVFDGHYE